MIDTTGINRRKFLKITGITGSVLALGYTSGFGKGSVKKFENDEILGSNMNDFVFIDAKGKITIVNHRPEMGQGVYQAMPMLIAEELEVEMDDVNIIQTKGDAKKYGHQMVGGSSSVRKSWEPSRKLGAAARMMFISAASSKWGLPERDCYAKRGKIYNNKNNKSITYGDLIADASKLEVPKEPKLKAKKDFKILGKPLPRRDTPMKVNGEAVFGLDLEVPEMLYASVERSPVFLGKVKSFNKDEVMRIAGVVDVIKTEMPVFATTREGVAIVAKDYFTALEARKTLKVAWDEAGYNTKNQEDIFNDLRTAGQKEEGFVDESKGDFKKAFDGAAKILESEYSLPYQAHATMEPMNCIVSVKDDTCEFWGPTQAPNWIRGSLAKSLGLKEENVTINVSFLGGGFGRRAFPDFPNEAAFISKQIGKPIKVVWKREDDNTQGPFRPGSVNFLKAGIDENNNFVALQHKTAIQAMAHQWAGADKSKKPDNVMEGINSEYELPNWSTNVVPVEQHIPVMWWRSVHASTNGFAHECFIDEVANELKTDPLKFRINLLEKEPRFVKVLEKAAKESGWNNIRKTNIGMGVAIVKSFGSICAHVVEVERQTNKKLKVKKVTSVIDCGMTVNNDTVKAQTEGNVVMALQAAYKGEITFKNGRAVEKNFNTYKMLRINETPEINVFVMDNEEAPGGVGEPGLPPLAPALCNAIFDESKNRIRKLPFDLGNV